MPFYNKNRLDIRYPGVVREWDCDKNTPLDPSRIGYGSHRRVWWCCCVCGHRWFAAVRSRTISGQGCPSCSGNIVSDNNRLSVVNPQLCLEWDVERNYPLTPEDISYGSGRSVWWKCLVCNYSWYARVYNRAKLNATGCPECKMAARSDIMRRAVLRNDNRLSVTHPHLCKEWVVDKNLPLTMEDVSRGSGAAIWWRCADCGNEWKAKPADRTSGDGHGCKICSHSGVSKTQMGWLDGMNIPGLEREWRVFRGDGSHYIVDGFDPETNTVYEFFGDYWHGNPKKFPQEKIFHGRTTFGALYLETMDKVETLRCLGYRVVYIWESDFKSGRYDNIVLEPTGVGQIGL